MYPEQKAGSDNRSIERAREQARQKLLSTPGKGIGDELQNTEPPSAPVDVLYLRCRGLAR